MKTLKYFLVKRILIILLLTVNGNLSAATGGNNHHEMVSPPINTISVIKFFLFLYQASVLPSQYNTTSKVILSSNPTVQIHVVKMQPANSAEKTIYVLKQKPKFNCQNDVVSKENALKSIINALKNTIPTTNNHIISPVHTPPMVFNPRPTNHYVPNQNAKNHFVYNIQNRKTFFYLEIVK